MLAKSILVCAILTSIAASQQFTVTPDPLALASLMMAQGTITIGGYSGSLLFTATAEVDTPQRGSWLTVSQPVAGPQAGTQTVTVIGRTFGLPTYGKFIGFVIIQINPPNGLKKKISVIFDFSALIPQFRLTSKQADPSKVVLNYQQGSVQTPAVVSVDYFNNPGFPTNKPFTLLMPSVTESGLNWLTLTDSNGQAITSSTGLTSPSTLNITVDPNALADASGNTIPSDLGLVALAGQGGAIEVDLTVTLVPKISGLAPSTAVAGGGAFTLTVIGSGFVSGSTVQWNSTALSTTYINSTQLSASVPADLIASAGSTDVTVVNAGGATSNTAAFITYAMTSVTPTITSLSQTSTMAGGGSFLLIVNGNNFLSGALVQWNGSALPTTFYSSSQLTATVDASRIATPGTASITVVNAGGTTSNSFVFSIIGTTPTITTLSPTSTSAGSGPFMLTVYGNGFLTGATVQWNGSALPTTFNSATQVTASVPANLVTAAGSANVTVANPGGTVSNGVLFSVQGVSSGFRYVPVIPCRIADTTTGNGTFGGPALAGSTAREFVIPNGRCGVPPGATAYSVNVTVIPHQGLSYLTLGPSGQPPPFVSILNSFDGRIKSNAAIVPAGRDGGITVFVTDTTDVLLDISGYFVSSSNPGSLAFYPLAPCRVADTRDPASPLGGPGLSGLTVRSFPVLAGPCRVPASAQAYSFNLTAVPHGPLIFLVAWPTGQPLPGVSSLNAPTGTLTANAAIVTAGTNGAVSVLATSDTDFFVDINGYFAPPGPGGLSLYTLSPCRVLDTRVPMGAPPFQGTIAMNVTGSGCGVPATAKAYVFNATVVPSRSLEYISLWPQGQFQPQVSTLNAVDGSLTSNMALVPTANGYINLFATDSTHAFVDVFGYFAP